jgi:TolB-like protein/Tfp pilus assembly protein PilF
MFTDIVGYTALMGSDEDKAFEILRKNRDIHNRFLKKFNGNLVKEIGDGMLLNFDLPSDAVRCAIKIQETCKSEQIPLKIGIHDGEVTFEGNDVFGDGVNITSRLQAEAKKGNIYVSGSVYRNVKNKSDIKSRFIDEISFKNVDELIKVYQILTGDEEHLAGKSNQKQGKKVNKFIPAVIILGILLIITASILIWKFYPLLNPSNVERSIAVMPFSNETGKPDNSYLANGMMEEIRNNLAKISDLRVLSKTSTDNYRDTQLSLTEIADQLNVNYLVEGSVQKQGDILKVHAQLINIEMDDNIWAETYTRNIDDLFALQSEIAQFIAEQLKVVITPEEIEIIEMKPTDNSEAYDLYLRGKEYFALGGESNLNTAIYFYRRAIDLDPEFALAYAWLGFAYFYQTSGQNYLKEDFADTLKYFADKSISINPELSDGYWLRSEYYRRLARHDSSIIDAKLALQFDPNNGQAFKTLGLNYYYKKDFATAFLNLEKASKILVGDLDQYPEILDDYATVYMSIGDYEKSHSKIEEITYYKPQRGYFGLWLLNLTKGEFDKSKIYLDSLCVLDSGSCRFPLMYYYIFSGQLEKFKPEADDFDLFSMASPLWKAYILTELKRADEAEKYFKQAFDYLERTIELERLSATGGMDPYDLAAQYAFVGEKKNAYQILHYMEEQKNLECWMIWWMQFDPRFETMREDAEFKAIIQRQENRYTEIRAEIDDLERAGML